LEGQLNIKKPKTIFLRKQDFFNSAVTIIETLVVAAYIKA
jgi:hypothetical protein